MTTSIIKWPHSYSNMHAYNIICELRTWDMSWSTSSASGFRDSSYNLYLADCCRLCDIWRFFLSLYQTKALCNLNSITPPSTIWKGHQIKMVANIPELSFGAVISMRAMKDCPQGGDLSSFLWSMDDQAE